MNKFLCSICESAFNFDNIPKILKNCNHNICSSCLKNEKFCSIDHLPIDLHKYGLKNFLTNTSVLEQLRLGQKNQKQLKNQKKQIKQENKIQSKVQMEKCLLHSKLADVICFQDGQMICSTCALFGEHKGHKILSYDQLLKKISEITEDALSLYDTIKTKQQSLSKQIINEYIQNEFKEKRSNEVKHIRNLFQKAIQKLRKIQKTVVSNLDLIISRTMKNLKDSISYQDTKEKIKQWQSQVQHLGTIAQDVYCCQSIKQALKYMNMNCQQNFLCKKGEYLSIQLTALQSTIKNKIDQQIEGTKCLFNERLVESLDEICKFDQKFSSLIKENEEKKSKMFSGLKISEQQNLQKNKQKQDQKQNLQKQNEDILLDTEIKNIQTNNQQFEGKLKQAINQVKKSSLYQQPNTQNNSLESSIICQISSLNISSFEDLGVIQQNNLKQSVKNGKITPRNQIQIKILPDSKKKITNCQNNHKSQSFVNISDILQKEPLKNTFDNHQIKKKKKLQIPQKYKSLWQDIKVDKIDQIDLTGAQLGDSLTLCFLQNISKTSKAKQLKLIRNKLTDQIIYDLLSCLRNCNVTNINLSQNGFTQKCLQTIEHYDLGNLKTITLSLNKINGRKVKDRLQALRQRGIIVSI